MPYQQLPDGRIVQVGQRPMKGLGDAVARATSLLGIPTCCACKQRQEMLNNVFPFRANGGRK